jgi:hypothetical protein
MPLFHRISATTWDPEFLGMGVGIVGAGMDADGFHLFEG